VHWLVLYNMEVQGKWDPFWPSWSRTEDRRLLRDVSLALRLALTTPKTPVAPRRLFIFTAPKISQQCLENSNPKFPCSWTLPRMTPSPSRRWRKQTVSLGLCYPSKAGSITTSPPTEIKQQCSELAYSRASNLLRQTGLNEAVGDISLSHLLFSELSRIYHNHMPKPPPEQGVEGGHRLIMSL
jgi:hypothetical protein